jgi:hypothetical protein
MHLTTLWCSGGRVAPQAVAVTKWPTEDAKTAASLLDGRRTDAKLCGSIMQRLVEVLPTFTHSESLAYQLACYACRDSLYSYVMACILYSYLLQHCFGNQDWMGLAHGLTHFTSRMYDAYGLLFLFAYLFEMKNAALWGRRQEPRCRHGKDQECQTGRTLSVSLLEYKKGRTLSISPGQVEGCHLWRAEKK